MSGVPNDSFLQSVKNSLLSNAHAVAEAVVPVLSVSKFSESGVLTPQEFVLAGDLLVQRFPTWQWAGGDQDKRRAFLPAGKQFLVTKGVPSKQRVRDLERDVDGDDRDAGEGWLATHLSAEGRPGEDGGYVDQAALHHAPAAAAAGAAAADEDDDYIDLDSFEEANLASADASTALAAVAPPKAAAAAAASSSTDTIIKTRTYDLSITYDKYYQTPRMWLFGYNEAGQPLPPIATFDDISADHANKTATIEAHPHTGAMCVSIHPCRHAQILKKMYDSLAGEANAAARVEQALIIFLKFMSAIIPTIEYDWTMQFRVGGGKAAGAGGAAGSSSSSSKGS